MFQLYKYSILFVFSIVLGFAFNMFLLPHEILSGGVTGLAMIFGLLTPINSGIWLVVLNVPIFIIGWLKLGKQFIMNSVFCVFVTSMSMQYIPVVEITDDVLLSSVFGGVIIGIAVGLIVRFYASSGGADIIGLVITQKHDIPLGGMIFGLNSIVVFISGFIFSWDLALYTMASIYISGIVVDRVHTRHIKLSLMVVSSKGDVLKDELIKNLIRGITVMNGEGGYSNSQRKVLYTVISRYELALVKSLIKKVDDTAFVSITETVEVMGNFRRN
ncbi:MULTISPECIES: YitT family protein [Paraliobacillus]|uniref:YitT family protein n=1 Tax=Paraliobacillus TaxID=200903 RepID=UPI000DD32C79|nr:MULTISPECIES: YitT family protein [Paraliobacillus]